MNIKENCKDKTNTRTTGKPTNIQTPGGLETQEKEEKTNAGPSGNIGILVGAELVY